MLEKNLQIMIVDDEAAILRTLSSYLNFRGYNCHTFEDPRKALGWLESNAAHIIITDLVMPGLDGLDFLRHVKARKDNSQTIIITAFSNLERSIEAYGLGVSDYLIKPFINLDEVGEVVDQAVARLVRWRKVFELALADESGK